MACKLGWCARAYMLEFDQWGFVFIWLALLINETFKNGLLCLFDVVETRQQAACSVNRMATSRCRSSSLARVEKQAMERSHRMYVGKVGVAVTGKGIEWDLSLDEDDLHAPGSTPSLVEWNNPCYIHASRTAEEAPSNRSVSCPEESVAADPGFPIQQNELDTHEVRIGKAWTVATGKAWTVAICALMGCRDEVGIAASLELMGNVVLKMERSELGQSSVQFDGVIREKRAAFPGIFSPSVEILVVSVAAKFKTETTACLPLHVLQLALGFIALAENSVLCTVSKEFREAAEGDGLWQTPYMDRFHKERCAGQTLRPSREREQADADGNRAATDTDGDCKPVRRNDDARGRGFKNLYMKRMKDPHVGDQVEVAWKGKFRLESFEVYNGMAWWVARVVRKGKDPGYYQVHYPGWEPRWDEWVPRERLRWGNERRAAALKGVSPQEGDSVEMWCEGVHVPGAWLEAVVHTVKNGRLYLGEVLTSGHFWVDAKHVRLVKRRGAAGSVEEGARGGTRNGQRSRSRGVAPLLRALGLRGCTRHSGGSSCSLM